MAHFVLDVNETLSDMSPLGDVLAEHGAPAELARTWFASVLRDGFALSLHGRAPGFVELGRQVLAGLLVDIEGLDAPVDEVVEHVVETLGRLDAHPDVVPGITALTDAGHTVSAFTNGAASSASGLLERAGVLDRIHRVLSVEGLGVWKPHPDAYAHAVSELGVAPGDLTMVAVHPWDLDGAAAAGLRTAWVDRRGTPWPAAFPEPGVRVGELAGLGR